jgi:hypothetical protein
MIWATRRFAYADYAPYQDRIDKLVWMNTSLHRQFMMASVETDKRGVSDVYVGIPTADFLGEFDGFTVVQEEELPKEFDTLIMGDVEEFKSRFSFRQRQR